MFYLIRGNLWANRVQSAAEGQPVTWGSGLNCCELEGKRCGSDVWRTGQLCVLRFHMQTADASTFCPLQSTLGYCALTMATVHTLLFGWNRAFDLDAYHFYLPPTFAPVLILPLVVLLSRLALLLPCLSARLRQIRRGWEKTRHIRFTLPEDGCHNGLEDVSHV